MTQIAKTWNARLDTGTLTKGQIGQVVQAIYPMAAGYSPGGKRTNLTESEAEAIYTRIEQGDIRVTEEQARQGRDWLSRYWKRLHMPEMDYATITHFRFAGAECSGYRTFAPIYWAYFPDGRVLAYIPTAWQSQAWNGAPDLPTWWFIK